jgi:hypothetical protein
MSDRRNPHGDLRPYPRFLPFVRDAPEHRFGVIELARFANAIATAASADERRTAFTMSEIVWSASAVRSGVRRGRTGIRDSLRGDGWNRHRAAPESFVVKRIRTKSQATAGLERDRDILTYRRFLSAHGQTFGSRIRPVCGKQ